MCVNKSLFQSLPVLLVSHCQHSVSSAATKTLKSYILSENTTQQERGQFPRVSKLCTPIISCALSWTPLEMHVVSQFLVHFVHFSGRAKLAHSAFLAVQGKMYMQHIIL